MVQFFPYFKLYLIATLSIDDHYFSLGCDSVIDKSTQDLWSTASDLTVNGYKAVFDSNGIATLQQSYAHLAPGGRLVTYGELNA